MNKINTIKTIFALVICALSSPSCQMNFDERLQHEAEEFTKNNCPQEPEAGTRLDSVAYSPQSKTYTLYYSLSAANEALYREQSTLLHYMLRQRLIDNSDYICSTLKKIGFDFISLSLSPYKTGSMNINLK